MSDVDNKPKVTYSEGDMELIRRIYAWTGFAIGLVCGFFIAVVVVS